MSVVISQKRWKFIQLSLRERCATSGGITPCCHTLLGPVRCGGNLVLLHDDEMHLRNLPAQTLG